MAIIQKKLTSLANLIPGYTTLVLFYLAGEALQLLLSSPIPGSIIGLLMLFLALSYAETWVPDSTLPAARHLISMLALLLLPASVGIFFLPPKFTAMLPALLGGIVLGTLLSMAIIGMLAQRLLPKHHADSPQC